MRLLKIILLCVCVGCASTKPLEPYQIKNQEAKKFARKNLANQKGWKLYTISFFALTLVYIDGRNSD